MNYAAEIKSRLTAREVFEHYGLTVNRSGFVCCPIHGEKTPSLKLFPGDRGWRCFGCGAGSSVVDFVMMYFGLPFADALKKLNEDFNLGLPIGRKLSHQEQIEAQRQAAERKKRIADREKKRDLLRAAYDSAFTEFVRLDAIKRDKSPTSPGEPFTDEFCDALKRLDGAWYAVCEADANLRDFEKTCYKSA